ncbi:MAG: hypothetical protein K6U03_08195, partial [Firmicutes bacterium]|nr:hypothetical protein [Bacillota bacterium]
HYAWWLALPLDPIEQVRIQSDLDTLAFARRQIGAFEGCLTKIAAEEERVPFLVQTTVPMIRAAYIGASRSFEIVFKP